MQSRCVCLQTDLSLSVAVYSEASLITINIKFYPRTLLQSRFYCFFLKLVKLSFIIYNIRMDNILLYVNIALLLCNVCLFAVLLIARARVVSVEKALVDLDWESVATIVGDLATVKRTVQKLNLRLNGMESIDPNKVLAKLQNVTGNVTPLQQPQKPTGG